MRQTDPSPAHAPPQLRMHRQRSADGTIIACHISTPGQASDGPDGGGTVVFAADLGESTPDAWQPQLDYLGRRYRMLAWDMRGAGRSSAPPQPRYDAAAHLEDLQALLEAAEVADDEPLVVFGSGVGARIALEAAAVMPHRVAAVVVMGGASGRRLRWGLRAAELARRLGGRREQCDEPQAKSPKHGVPTGNGERFAERPSASPARRVGGRGALRLACGSWLMRLVAMTTGVPVATDTSRRITACIAALGTAEALPLTRWVRQPCLVLCGAHDPHMPAALAHQLARHLVDSEVEIIDRAGGQLPLRFPDLVNLRIERFLDRIK